MSADEAPECCGQPMYRCNGAHIDGKDYFHCHSCAHNVEVTS